MSRKEQLQRAFIATLIAFTISFSGIKEMTRAQHMPPGGPTQQQYDNCRGARFMQIMNTASGIAICGFFGPVACAGYAGIVLAYEVFAWYETGGC